VVARCWLSTAGRQQGSWRGWRPAGSRSPLHFRAHDRRRRRGARGVGHFAPSQPGGCRYPWSRRRSWRGL